MTQQRPQTVSRLPRGSASAAIRQPQTTQAALPAPGRFAWLTPMMLWPLARHYLPRPAIRPQGGGTQRADDEAMFAAIVYVLVSGVPWRALPKTFAVSWQNAHRRFTQWSEAGLWDRVREGSRRQQMPAQMRQWADMVGALAEERMNRATAPVERPAAATGRGAGLRPGIRVHQPGDFTVRLFGPGRTPADGTARELRRAQ
ncbi:transposase [Streptomyces regalis]|uniref:Insertion element IS402-like domain-containing protein n=1 Tax=Streptomyces regalis TaxID=68262 RepID=A0A0X3V4L1_9ACTN|nr:transposase [Streptomyces regalis]KUL39721.1 hypothetical protein ADL12_14770 [Streptomyces regalis]